MKLNKRGAASILVILIIVVLATFGGVALTAGWTNKQLSIKAAQSKADYYALDAAAEEIVAEVDSMLYSSMNEALDYLNGIETPESEDYSALYGDEKQAVLYAEGADSIINSIIKTQKITETFKRLYYYQCAKSLETFAAEKGLAVIYSDSFAAAEDFLNPENKLPASGDLLIYFTVSEGDEAGQKSLDIEIAVLSPSVDVEINDEDLWRTEFAINEKDSALRFEIYSWKLSQNPIEYEEENPKFG